MEAIKKDWFIDSEIKSFIGENTTQEQIKFFDDNFKTNFNSFFKKYDQLIFIIYVRHLIVHYGGIVTKEFEIKISKLKNIRHSLNIKRGEKLELTPLFIMSNPSTPSKRKVSFFLSSRKEAALSRESKFLALS